MPRSARPRMVSTRRKDGTPAAPAAHVKRPRERPSRVAAPAGRAGARRADRGSRRRDDVAQAEALRKQVERLARDSGPARWNANPDDDPFQFTEFVLIVALFGQGVKLIKEQDTWTCSGVLEKLTDILGGIAEV